MREYLLPFEIASVLLLMALIGAIVIAFEERTRRRRVLTLAEEVALKRRGIVEPRDADGAVVPVEEAEHVA
jgi:NADH-quinone oxidoreductase subunit J